MYTRNRFKGMVYTMTNCAERNEVVAFHRQCNGKLEQLGTYPTGGKGSGPQNVSSATPENGISPLASQGSLVLSSDGCHLFAANAGSENITSFLVAPTGELTLKNIVNSGGFQPNSMGAYGELLYVSNVGNCQNNFTSNVTGFRIEDMGSLCMIPNSTHPLSTPNAQPARVLFRPDGKMLVVSELTTNRLSVFKINSNGTLSPPVVNNSNGAGPCGSCFLPSGNLLVAETGANALSTYNVAPNGLLNVLNGSVPTGQSSTCGEASPCGQMSPCSVVTSKDGQFCYASNADSCSLTCHHVNQAGRILILDNKKNTPEAVPPGAPIDNGVSRDGHNFYVLNGNQGSITVFRIKDDRRLLRIQYVTSLQMPKLGAQGLAVR